MFELDESGIANGKACASGRPHPLAANPVRQCSEADLAGNADHTDDTEGPGRGERLEANLDEILGLVHLHGVPGDEGAEVAKHDPPESAGCHRARERPFDGRPGRVGDVDTTLARYRTDGRPA